LSIQAFLADVPPSDGDARGRIRTSVAAPGAAPLQTPPPPARGSRLSFDEDRLDPNQYPNDPLTYASLSSVATSKTILRDTRLQL
jgi:hypothetical protein